MQYFTAGKFVAVFGVDGALVLQHVLGKKTGFKGLQVLFLEDKKDSFLPWFIQEVTIKNEQEVYVKPGAGQKTYSEKGMAAGGGF
jgi:16S rRNA processing protein RimM